VSGTRLLLSLVAALTVAASLHASLLPPRKPRLDAGRVKQLAETLRTDPDEKKRRAAIAELKEADPRQLPDAMTTLVSALQRDPSPAVRADAAEAIGSIKVMVPIAGAALETAAESDLSPGVRDAAQQALWEYHLIGYRSTKGADGIAGQTAEPPIARPALVRPVVTSAKLPVVPTSPPVQPAVGVNPPPLPVPVLPNPPPTGPKPEVKNGIRTLVTAAPPIRLNETEEPPVALPGLTPTPANLDTSISAVTLPPVSLPPNVDANPHPATIEAWTPPRYMPSSFRSPLQLLKQK
jgi:hypothetical protein